MNGQTNACLCGVWSCQPAAKYVSCKSPKKLPYLDTKQLHWHLTSIYVMGQGFKSRSSCMLGKQPTTIHTPNNFWILLLFFFLTGSHLAKAVLKHLIFQWSEIPGVYYHAWSPALALSLFKRQGLTK